MHHRRGGCGCPVVYLRPVSATFETALRAVDDTAERIENGITIGDDAAFLSGNLREFLRRAWPLLEPDRVVDGKRQSTFRTNWHIDAICEHLEACRALEIRRLLINIPPRHMKSLTVSVFWPVWRWTFEPEIRFLTFSYADDLAQRDAIKSRDVLRSQWYRDRWPNVVLKKDVNRLDRYENTLAGHRIAEHVRSGTGEGGDIIIIDDPHDAEKALSDAERKKVLRWHSNTASSRFNDPATGVQVVVKQRLHEKDLSGHVLDQEGWTHLCLPARFDPKHPFLWPDDPRTEYGDVLWEEHVPKPELDRLQQGMTARDIAGQFQQIPAPLEGDLLKTKDWRYYSRELTYYAERRVFDAAAVKELASAVGEFRHIIHSWDTSVKDRANSDSVSCTVWGAIGANRYMLRTLNAKLGLNATIEAMDEIGKWALDLWPDSVHWIVVEEAANGPDAIRELKKRLNGVVAWPAKGTKGMRAEAASTALVGHNCYLPGEMLDDGSGYAPNTPPDVQAFIERLARVAFDALGHSIGGPDDDCDSWSMAMNYLRTKGSGMGRTSVPQGRTD